MTKNHWVFLLSSNIRELKACSPKHQTDNQQTLFEDKPTTVLFIHHTFRVFVRAALLVASQTRHKEHACDQSVLQNNVEVADKRFLLCLRTKCWCLSWRWDGVAAHATGRRKVDAKRKLHGRHLVEIFVCLFRVSFIVVSPLFLFYDVGREFASAFEGCIWKEYSILVLYTFHNLPCLATLKSGVVWDLSVVSTIPKKFRGRVKMSRSRVACYLCTNFAAGRISFFKWCFYFALPLCWPSHATIKTW